MTRITLIVTAALATLALAAPAALANAIDAPQSTPVNPGTTVLRTQDLRSPDARDTAARLKTGQDRRSPDTRDIAAGRQYPPTPTVVTLKAIQPSEPVPATGFDWTAAATGAAALLGIILMMTAAALILTRRRAHRDQPVAAA